LKRKHVTLLIVWDEYIAANPGGYSYSRFCELYRGFEAKLSPTMRQTHAAGERLFVDYAGDGVPVVIDRLTGEIRMAQIFVAVLGASSFTFARATWTQTLVDWVDAHVRAFEAIGGVPQLLVPDNTKTAVIKACLYDPLVNRTYADPRDDGLGGTDPGLRVLSQSKLSTPSSAKRTASVKPPGD
jgi:transposase